MAVLPPLATVADLAALMHTDVDPASADVALSLASGVIRRWTRQDITLVTDDPVTLRVIDGTELVLPQRPVVSVSQVKAGSVTLGDWVLSGDRLLRPGGWRHLSGGYPDPGLVQVTYTHGWPEIPDDIRAVCLDLASMTLTNPSGLREVAIDDFRRVFASETLGAGTLSAAHKEILKDYRRRFGTVTLR